MHINTNQKNYSKEVYRKYFFWENQVINNSSLWGGCFEDKEITKDSKFLYVGIIDYEKNIIQSSFIAYPSIYMLLGFLQHVFLPTALFTWFERQAKDFYIPLAPFSEVVYEITENSKNINVELINSMLEFHSSLDKSWNLDEKALTEFIKSTSNDFNYNWDMDPSQKLFFKVFDSPSEIYDFIRNVIGWSDFNDFVEEEISMSLESFKFTCDNVIKEPLLNRNFIDILNTNIPILI